MNKAFVVAICLGISVSCIGKPKINFSTLNHDFGKQPQNQSVKHIFIFNNIGTGKLIIEKIQAG